MSRRLARLPSVSKSNPTPPHESPGRLRRPTPQGLRGSSASSSLREGYNQTPLLGWPLVGKSGKGAAAAAASGGASGYGRTQILAQRGAQDDDDDDDQSPLPSIGDQSSPVTPSKSGGGAAGASGRTLSPTSAVDFPTTPTSAGKKSPKAGSGAAGLRDSPPRGGPVRLKVVLDMDECLIHSIFDQGVTPGRVAYGRGAGMAPPPSPPPNFVAPIDSFPLTMLDKAQCLVNKRPRVDWFLQEVTRARSPPPAPPRNNARAFKGSAFFFTSKHPPLPAPRLTPPPPLPPLRPGPRRAVDSARSGSTRS